QARERAALRDQERRREASLARAASNDERSECKRGSAQPVMLVFKLTKNSVEFDHYPVRSIKEASRYLLMSRPPLLGEEGKVGYITIWATTLAPVAKICRRAIRSYAHLQRSNAVPDRHFSGSRAFQQTHPQTLTRG